MPAHQTANVCSIRERFGDLASQGSVQQARKQSIEVAVVLQIAIVSVKMADIILLKYGSAKEGQYNGVWNILNVQPCCNSTTNDNQGILLPNEVSPHTICLVMWWTIARSTVSFAALDISRQVFASSTY